MGEVKQSSDIGNSGDEPIAIIGFAFEFPQGATSERAFWQMILDGRSASTEFSPDRMNIDAFYHPDLNRPSSIPLRGGHFVQESLGSFDAPFFSITPEEAACMDPQHRRLLETAYHALEDAGVPISKCSGSNTSVYTGCFTNDYLSILQQDYDAEQRHAAMGIAPSMLANRLSWFYNFKGTSMNLDSACSSSLIALHLACQDLRAGNSEMALVGGANLVYHPNFMKIMSDFNFLSPDSRCWSFDKRANGYARGEGLAVILLKRLDDALRNGDTIRAVIRNTGTNQDGRTLGITQPSEEAQIDLIKQTYQRAGIDMAPTRFFEAHATGTPVGDPVEGNAIGTAFREYRSEHEPLYIGAVKANIGHLEGCSGLAGIIKAILVLEKGIIPPIAGFESLNDRIDAKKLHLHFPTEAVPWPTVPVRRACINSFGFGGTNAVAILDDAYHYFKLNGIQGFHRTQLGLSENGQLGGLNGTQINGDNQISVEGVTNVVNGYEKNVDDHTQNDTSHTSFSGNAERTISEVEGLSYEATPPILLVWSASDQQGAQNISKDYKNYLSTEAVDLNDLAYTLAVRRSHFKWRNFSVVSSTNREIELSAPVKAAANKEGIAFVFTGQGAQYLGMGRHLLSYPIFRNSLTRSDHCLRQLGCQWSLLDIISGKVEIDIDSPEYSQPLTTCLQLALVDLLRSFDIVPSLVLGHSSGEVAAAYASGVLSAHSAIKITYWRGQLSAQLIRQVQGLTMMAVGLSKEQTIPYLNQLYESDGSLNVAVGCVNSPNSVTLTGKADQLAKLETWLKDKGIFARKLRVNASYHSRFMNPIAEDYCKAIDGLQINQSSGFVPMVSSVTGDIVTVTMLGSPDYWVRNLTSTVEFEAAFSKLLAVASTKPRKQLGKSVSVNHRLLKHVLEIGPHGALQGPIRDNMKALDGTPKLNYIASLSRSQDASVALLNAVGTLYCLGYPVNLLRANDLDDFPRPIPANIPRYPFNHAQSYWREGQLSRNLRFRSIGRHDLLGTRGLDWNPLMAQWRNIMRLNELPWLEDHTIGGEIVFPAAGMISMAVEALTQLLEDDVSLQGINIENVAFSHVISFPRGVDNIETQLTLSRPSQTSDHTKWSHFRLFVLENGSYIECCSGSIRAVVDTHDRNRVTSSGPWARYGILKDWIVDIDEACKGPEKNAYDVPEDITVRYGPAFQNLEHMRVGTHGEAIAHVNTETWKSKSPGVVTPHFIVHPATLDGLAQPLLQALLAQEREVVPTMVPVRLARLWIDCSANALRVGRLKVAARCSFRGYRGGSADVVAMDPDSGKLVIFLSGLETTFISSTNLANPREAASSRPLCNQLTWKPDIEAMTHEQVLHYSVHGRPRLPVDAVKDYLELMIAIMCFIQDTLAFIDEHPEIKLPWHLDAYIDWMRYQQGRLQNGEALVTEQAVQQMRDSGKTRENLVKKIENSGVDGFFFMQIGRNLTKMLRGEIDPLAFMFQDRLADRYYEKMLANNHHAYPASRYIDLLSFKNPSMRILEVGAGTGGQTMRLLEAMSSDGVKKWAHYDYTDISPSFFSQARVKFAKYVDQMQFRVFDISNDPTSQSFEEGSYDLVVASHVLHATDKLGESLRHIRKLLKPDGILLLFETTRTEALQVTFAFGLLKGWWNPLKHEERSPYSPCLTVEQWDVWLKRAGFTGIDVEIPGQEEPVCRDSSIIVSSAASVVDLNTKPAPLSKIYLVVEDEVRAQQALAQVLEPRLSEGLAASCETVVLADLAKTSIPSSSLLIFLVEVDKFLLNDISERDYRNLQSVLVQTKNTIWVTRADSSDDTDPRHHLVLGLGRTLMSEDSSLKFVTLTLSDYRNEEQVSTLICELTQRVVKLAVENLEGHYVVSKGVPKICRVSENAEMDTKIAQATLPRQRINFTLTPDAPVMELHLGQPGHLNTLQWREVDDMKCRDTTSLGVNEVVVQVRALGLTFRDYLVASGQLDEPGLSTDCSGIIQSAGEKSGFKVGDRVCFIAPSKSCTLVRITASAVIAIPPHMSFAEGASIPSALWLSYRAAVDVARIEKDETVLIHHASSCVGQMAVQVAQRLGARVLATVTEPSGPRGALLRDRLGIPDDNIFDTKDGSIIGKIFQKTNGAGVDVVIGPLKDEGNVVGLDFSECLASFSRQVDVSLLRPYNSMSGLRQCGTRVPLNISQASIDMVDLFQRKPSAAHATFQRAAKMAFGTDIKPPHPLHVLEASDIEVAFREFGSSKSVGRRVIELNPDMEIVANVKTKPRYNFRPDATYVIAGGLGGLGRSFARWMVGRGARNLILLSRSGASGKAAKALMAELSAQGICVATPAVDISNLDKLKNEIEKLKKRMPPIRGCIQATVALRDNLFPNMTFEDWIVGTGSKATGSWNLHTVLPSGLDFFVLLASLNGIVGGRAQANYAAGNTFKDALAHYRLSRGEKAVSLDLGLMVSEGVIAENEVLLANMRRLGHLMDISQDELLAILDYYCDPALPLLSHDKAQILVGLETPAAVRAKGIDLHHSIYRPIFRQLFRMGTSSMGDEASQEQNLDTDRVSVLRRETSDERATEMVTSWFVIKTAQVLGLDTSDVDPDKPVHAYGIDSLVAIDLKNWFAREIGAEIQVFFLLGNSPIKEVAREAAVRSTWRPSTKKENNQENQ